MSVEKKYLLDSNVFIGAHRSYYAFDIAPTFWQSIKDQAQDGKIISIDRVKNELQGFGEGDLLREWSISEFNEWFFPTDTSETLSCYADLMIWTQETPQQEHYRDFAITEFAEEHIADAWLIAYAMANDCILVTHEVYDEKNKKKIPIPNVCAEKGVHYIDTFQMFRELGIKL
jgi:hypothetical protein